MCKTSNRYREKWPRCAILNVAIQFCYFETATFHAVPGEFCIFTILISFRFGPFKECSRILFTFLAKNWPKKCITPRRQNITFSVWPFLDFVTLHDLDLEYANRKLRMILRSVPAPIHVVTLTYFHLIQLWCATKPDTPNRQRFWIWPDKWRHWWPRSQQHQVTLDTFSRSIVRRLSFVNRTNSSWVLRGGGQKIPPTPPWMSCYGNPLSGAG